jgi:branched-subunit amino acid aminotransferase/4-amino-4-deoxychorismate lyase
VLVRRAGLRDAAIRLTITRGAAGDALLPARRTHPTILLTARPLPADLVRRRRDGIAVVTLPFARDAGPYWGRLKLIGHASAVVGRRVAARARADEGLYVTPDGYVTEATTANVFVVEGRRLLTPPLDAGILPGVTRALVLALARRAGLTAHERAITVGTLRRADEIFLTASTVEVVPVVRLDGRRVGGGKPGAVTRLVQERYAAHVMRAVVRLRRT